MLISIVIPVYNRAHIVQRTLKSVVAQTHRPLQVVLVDNCSNDDTLTVLQDFKAKHNNPDFEVIVAQETHHTAAAARNKGFSLATARWVMFFDSDDEMHPSLAQKYAHTIEQNQENIDMVLTRGEIVALDGTRRNRPYFENDLIANHILHCIFSTAHYIVRRSAFEATGGWNKTIRGWDDWEVSMRLMLQQPRVAFIDETLMTIYDSGADSITGTEFSSRHGEWEHVIDLMTQNVQNSHIDNKSRYLDLLDFRRIMLAAHYAREGNENLGKELYHNALQRLNHNWPAKLFMPLFYHWAKKGRRGMSRIAHLMIR